MLNFGNAIAKVFSLLANFSNKLSTSSSNNPKTASWITLGVGLLGVFNVKPEVIKSTLLSVAEIINSLANMV